MKPNVSVYSSDLEGYRYYHVPSHLLKAARYTVTPPHSFGWTVDEALRQLPAGATFLGTGEAAIGELMSPGSGGLGLCGWLGLGFLAWLTISGIKKRWKKKASQDA